MKSMPKESLVILFMNLRESEYDKYSDNAL